MQASSATRPRPRRRAPLALLTALLTLAGATQALAPASASAMTEQQRQKAFCETVAYILNDPGLCAAESKSGSGGGDGGIRYGATEPWPGVIDIVAPKPREERSVNCGFGIHAARQVDCPRRPGGDRGQRIEGSRTGPGNAGPQHRPAPTQAVSPPRDKKSLPPQCGKAAKILARTIKMLPRLDDLEARVESGSVDPDDMLADLGNILDESRALLVGSFAAKRHLRPKVITDGRSTFKVYDHPSDPLEFVRQLKSLWLTAESEAKAILGMPPCD